MLFAAVGGDDALAEEASGLFAANTEGRALAQVFSTWRESWSKT